MFHLITSNALEETEALMQKHLGTFILFGEEMQRTQAKTTTSFGMPLFLRWKVACRRDYKL
jgi:hypothetical protein